MSVLRIPRSTYRLQMNGSFRFADARAIVDYLDALGISDVYSSPILKARSGSQHGYDVVDPDRLNPELGPDEDFTGLTDDLRARDMGLLLDVVPNHMAASHENPWWMSVLENGSSSRYAHYFDVDWTPAPLTKEPKVFLPILGRPYGEALEQRELRLSFGENGFRLHYYDHELPVNPRTWDTILRKCCEFLDMTAETPVRDELRDLIAQSTGDHTVNTKFVKQTLWRLHQGDAEFRDALDTTVARINGTEGDSESLDELDALLELQPYRLAYWRIASEEINYRRFFDIADLVGVRVEQPEVFEARHVKILDLIAEGRVTGLRIDHIDGLYDPVSHLRRVQSRTSPEWNGDARNPAFYVVVEKILELDEPLPEAFATHGTTGYDSLNYLNGLAVDPHGLATLTDIYRWFLASDGEEQTVTDEEEEFDAIAQRSKRRVIEDLFSGEIRRLGMQLLAIAAADRNARDFSNAEMMTAFIEVTAALPVYRSYIRDVDVAPGDRKVIERAVRDARRALGSRIDPRVFRFLRSVFLLEIPRYADGKKPEWLDFVMRWQQFTGRVTAKGLEDTAFYVYNRILSMNEVGGEPGGAWLRDPVAQFHERNARELERWPARMNATSTHDTKRSEDLRARLNVLSELPDLWRESLDLWSRMNEELRVTVGGQRAPDRNEEMHIYQTLLGMWPFTEEEEREVPQRIATYLEKAAREAKVHSSWLAPDAPYEEALISFARGIIDPSRREFLESFRRLQTTLAWYGHLNSLAQVVMKIAMPGVPDTYQGMEMWDFSLVDPDNRRPVDYERRRRELEAMRSGDRSALLADLLANWKDGRVKLFTTHRALEARRAAPELFLRGTYLPLEATRLGRHVCAFAREHEGRWAVVAVPRLVASIASEAALPLGEAVWNGAALPLPAGAPAGFENVFTGERVAADGGGLSLASLFSRFPVAILMGGELR